MKNRLLLAAILVIVFMGTYISSGKAEELEITSIDGELWVTASGELFKAEMTAVTGVWQEYALRLADGEVCILLGELVSELEGLIGREITVSGVLKPRMRYAAKLTRTIEIRSIDNVGKVAASPEGADTLVTLKGELSMVRISDPSEDMARFQPGIETADGVLYLLVGTATYEELKALAGTKVKVTGRRIWDFSIKDATGENRPMFWVEEIEEPREIEEIEIE